ncbi:MAG TPA: DUF5329 family protein [Phycisphaerae bacterium]|nr:DUF5329 family protein [Phycisphaerae bacterium]
MIRHIVRPLPLILILALAAPVCAARSSLSARDKATINTLLDRISHSDLKFVRLDKIYGASTTVHYMRFKWHQNESKVNSVQDFINLESIGGAHGEVTYYVQYPDGHRRPAKVVMEETVRDIQKGT